MHGITVTLYERTQSGVDELNRPTYTETAVPVENVLVGQPTESEITDTLNLYGRKIQFVLGLPKGDTHEWTGCKVEFFGRRFEVVGDVIEGIEHLIPGPWHKKVRVEAINK